MKSFKYNLLLIVCLLHLICRGQTLFDKYYTTGYHNNKSSSVISEVDSNYIFVNQIVDSVTNGYDLGLIRLDKNGNEVIKRSFNMYYQNYFNFSQGENNFIKATPSSYFLSGVHFDGNKQGFIVVKFDKTTLDSIKTLVYSDTFTYAMNNLIKFNDNKYYLIGNKWRGNNTSPIIVQLDSNLNIIQKTTVNTKPDFGNWNAIYNPVNKKILLGGGSASGQYLNTFIHIDTLGSFSKTVFGPKYMDRAIMKIYYRALDTSYITVGYLHTGTYGGNRLTKLCIGKYDTNLKLKWEKTYGDGMIGNSLFDGTILNDGSIVVSGCYSQLINFTTGYPNLNGVILKVNKDGDLVWAREYDHVPAGNPAEILNSIDKTPDKGFILCGTVHSPVNTKAKAWAIKTDSLGCASPGCIGSVMRETDVVYSPFPPPDTTQRIPVDTTNHSTVSLTKIEFSKTIRIYPNPVNKFLKIELIDPFISESKEYNFVIISTLGQIVLDSGIIGAISELDLSSLKNGIYFIRIFDKDKQVLTEKLVKE